MNGGAGDGGRSCCGSREPLVSEGGRGVESETVCRVLGTWVGGIGEYAMEEIDGRRGVGRGTLTGFGGGSVGSVRGRK